MEMENFKAEGVTGVAKSLQKPDSGDAGGTETSALCLPEPLSPQATSEESMLPSLESSTGSLSGSGSETSDNELDLADVAESLGKPLKLMRNVSEYDPRGDRLIVRLNSLMQGSESAFYRLLSASINGDARVVEKCLQMLSLKEAQQLNPIQDAVSYGLSALHLASTVRVCDLLLEFGFDVDIPGVHGQTPLHYHTHSGNLDVIEFLLDSGANVNAKTKHDGSTPLQWAVAANERRIVQKLIRAGADVNFSNHSGNMALHLATSVDVTRYLVSKGARTDVCNKHGRIPLEEAALRANSEEEQDVAVYLLRLSQQKFRSSKSLRARQQSSTSSADETTPLTVTQMSAYGSSTEDSQFDRIEDSALLDTARTKWNKIKQALLAGKGPFRGSEGDENERTTSSNEFFTTFFNLIVREQPKLAKKVLDQQRAFLFYQDNARVFSYKTNLLGSIPHSSQALRDIVYSGNVELVSHPVVQFIINCRWTLFTREVLFIELFIHIIFTICLTYTALSSERKLSLQAMRAENLPWLIVHMTLIALNFRYVLLQSVQARLMCLLQDIKLTVGAFLHCQLRNESFYMLPHIVIILAEIFRMIPTAEDPGPFIIAADLLLALCIPRMFYRILGFGEGYQSIGVPLATMRSMVTRNKPYFLVLFTLILGFSMSMAVIFRDSPETTQYFSSWPLSFVSMFMFIFDLDTVDLFQAKNEFVQIFAFFVLGVYMIAVSLVVVNLIIAVMTNTYEEINQNSTAQWYLQRARLVLFYEQHELAMNSLLFRMTNEEVKAIQGQYFPVGSGKHFVKEIGSDVIIELPKSYMAEILEFRMRTAKVYHRVRYRLFRCFQTWRGPNEFMFPGRKGAYGDPNAEDVNFISICSFHKLEEDTKDEGCERCHEILALVSEMRAEQTRMAKDLLNVSHDIQSLHRLRKKHSTAPVSTKKVNFST